MAPTRLLVADDHELIRVGLRHILEEQPSWKVIAEASDGREAVMKAHETKPDIVIMDIAMPLLNGLEACKQLVSQLPNTRVLILSMHDTDSMIRSVLDAGARGYLLKSDARRDLVAAVEAIRSNKTFFTAKVSQIILDGYLKPQAKGEDASDGSRLTARQREVLQLLAEGKSSKEVATVLNMSVKTAETHRANIMRRLDCHSVSELVRYAVRNEVIQP
jgi:DNA-binding NarL/FixJ family response regulator